MGIGFYIMHIAEQDGLGNGSSWCFAVAPVLSGNFLWFGLIGMEHLLFILLSLAWVEAWFRPLSRPHLMDRAFLGLLPFLLVLTRPEGAFLILLLLVCARRIADRTRRDVLIATGSGLCGIILTCSMNWVISGQLAPPTMRGRQFLYGPNAGLHSRIYFLGQTFVRITKTWRFQPPQQDLHGLNLLLGIAVGLIFAVLICFALRRLFALAARRILFLCAWAILIELLYFTVLPNTGHGGRYIAFSLMLFFCLSLFGLRELLVATIPDNRLVWAGVIIVALATAFDSYRIWTRAAAADIDQINSEHGMMAEWLQQSLPPSDFTGGHVAVFDIGRIGYQFRGNIVDLGGLVDGHYLPFLMEHRTAIYLKQRDVRYVVLPTGPNDTGFARALALDQQHGVSLSLVHSVCADSAAAELASESTAPAPAFPCQRLYAITYIPHMPHE